MDTAKKARRRDMRKKLEKYMREVTLNLRRDRELDLNRRGFIASSLAFLALAVLSSLPFAAKALGHRRDEELVVKIAERDALSVGDSVLFHYPDESKPAILVRTEEREYRSYYIKCTHLMCPVYWDKPSGNLLCPCHNGSFSVRDGSVIAGPPTRPLPSIELELRGDGIYAVGSGEGVSK